MLVKVNDNYTGVFGLRSSYSVVPKRAGDPPFEVPDDSAAYHIRTGVLVPVEVSPIPTKAPEPEKVTEVTEEAPPDIKPAEIKPAENKPLKKAARGKRK